MPTDTPNPDDLSVAGNRVLVAKLGVEGGGITIYGTECDGAWSFWAEGSSMDLDENDDEVWRRWSSKHLPDLVLILPPDWPLHYPLAVHPRFVGWFRVAYEKTRSALSPELRRYQEDSRHYDWMSCLGM